MRAVFYDTWAFLALANAADKAHALAASADSWREERRFHVVTTDYVLDEALTGLHAAAGAKVVLAFAEGFLARVAAETVSLIEINAPRRNAALDWFRRLAPETPGVSFTDCTSFAIMHELGIRLALTSDRHFHRAGKGVRPLVEIRGTRMVFLAPE